MKTVITILFCFAQLAISAQPSFQRVSEMIDSQGSIVSGDIVRTAGYWVSGDGGGAEYIFSDMPGVVGVDIQVGERWAKILPENGSVSFRSCGAIGDGIVDDLAAVQALFSAANSGRFHTITGGVGKFRISRNVLMRCDTAVTVDLTGSTIIYPSDNPALGGDASTLWTEDFQRSAFFVRDCYRIRFIGGKFAGSQTPDISKNKGSGIYLFNSSFCTVSDFESLGGASAVQQSQQPNDYGAIVRDGVCKSPAKALTVGDMSLVENVYFEQPTTGAASPNYFSHPFYVFAPHKYITVRKCTFKGGDRASIQVSGSNAPLGHVLIEDCVFLHPQGIFYGGDDAGNKRNWHADITIRDCKAFGQNLSIAAYGIRGLTIRDNFFEFSKSYNGSAVVSVERLGATNNSSILRDAPGTLIIEGNQWVLSDTARFTFAGVGSVLDIYDTGNRWDSIGTPCLMRIANNRMVGTSYLGINIRECANFEVTGNYVGNMKGGIKVEKSAFGKVDGNLFCADTLSGILSDVNDFDNCAWMEIGQNCTIKANKSRKNETGAWYSIEGALNAKTVFNVSAGWARPTHGKQQAVMFFGASWCDGDSVKVGDAGTAKTYLFKAAFPGAGQFNSMQGLMSLIAADFSTLQCRDYGDSMATVTRAILIEKKIAGVAGQFWVQTFSQHLNSGVHLATNADGRTYSRGGCCSGDKVVAWSPDANPQSGAQLFTKDWKVNESESVVGACVVFDLPALSFTTMAYRL